MNKKKTLLQDFIFYFLNINNIITLLGIVN